jgi:hypothetical protein
MRYELADPYKKLRPDQLVTWLNNGDVFTLDSKPFEVMKPADKTGPARTTTIKPASQAQLKKLFDMKHKGKKGPMVVEVQTKA